MQLKRVLAGSLTVQKIATELGVSPFLVAGALQGLQNALESTEDASGSGTLAQALDAVAGVSGLYTALESHGAVHELHAAIRKRRQAAQRMRKCRGNKRNVTRNVARNVTRNVTHQASLDSCSDSEQTNGTMVLPFNSLPFKEAWKRWESYKLEEGKPLTSISAITQLRLLSSCSEEDAIYAIDRAIAAGYPSVLPPRPAAVLDPFDAVSRLMYTGPGEVE